jgi:hypothetical protein
VSIAVRVSATTGIIRPTWLVPVLGVVGALAFATTTIAARFDRGDLRQKLLPAVFTAKIVVLAVMFGMESRRFVHGHAANGIFRHNVLGSSLIGVGCIHLLRQTHAVEFDYTLFSARQTRPCSGPDRPLGWARA